MKTIIALISLVISITLAGAQPVDNLSVRNLNVTSSAPNFAPITISTFFGLGANAIDIRDKDGNTIGGFDHLGNLTGNSDSAIDFINGTGTNLTVRSSATNTVPLNIVSPTHTNSFQINNGALVSVFDNNGGLTIGGSSPAGGSNLVVNGTAAFIGATTNTSTLKVAGALTAFTAFNLGKTINLTGTNAYQTINLPSGRVMVGAGTNTYYLTNSLAATTSVVVGGIGTADATANGLRLVPTSGLITITLLTAPTAETAVNWIITN